MNDFKNMFQAAPEETGFALIDEGTYEAEIVDCKLDLTKEPNHLTVVYQITNDERYQNNKIFGNYHLEGRGIGFLKKDMATLGFDYENVGSPEDLADLFWNNMPIPVVIYMKHKEYNGKTYANVYLNDRLDIPGALDNDQTGQREAERQAKVAAQAAKPATRPAPAPAPAIRQAAKPAAKPTGKPPMKGKPPQKKSGEPSFADGDEIPF